MSNMLNIAGLNSQDNVEKIDSGSGEIREKTIEIGNTFISINNIGSIVIFDGKKTFKFLVFGLIVAFLGIGMIFQNSLIGFVLITIGIILVIINFFQKADVFLSIGTSDGRRTHIVSKDKKFLRELLNFLRKKIDEGSSQKAALNISAGTLSISGGIALGNNSIATGQGGNVGSEGGQHG